MHVKRNSLGEIIAVGISATPGMDEWVQDNALEIQEFLRQYVVKFNEQLNNPMQMTLEKSDQGMARVLEDLIDILIDSGTIRFTDLPTAAQAKLLTRHNMRARGSSMNLLDDEENFGV
jgi:hypothetical protein